MNINRRRFVGLSTAAIAAPHIALAGQSFNIVCTVGMLADTAKQIAPANVTIRALMGPGTDPHAFRQTRSDVVALTKTDLIIRHGLYLEAQMEDLFAKLGKRKPILSAGEAVPNQNCCHMMMRRRSMIRMFGWTQGCGSMSQMQLPQNYRLNCRKTLLKSLKTMHGSWKP